MLWVPKDRLPSTAMERHAVLRDYFCDKDATPLADGERWALDLAWPDGDERHVDPRLDEGLAWWGDGVTRPTMALARRRRGRLLSALYDTWTLHSWSQWIAAHRPGPNDDILILHVDDHRDLGTPRLIEDGPGWWDPIAGAPVRLDAPDSVEAALDSGALGMGSILTPFLHRFPRAEVRHLCQPPKATATEDYRIVATTEPDTLLEPGRRRPAITLASSPGETGPGRYRLTPDVDDWLAGANMGAVLLHIDMDYFNNRFDGDSEWPTRSSPFDPSLDQMLGKIDEMIGALRRTGVGARIEDVVIAYSPGFFPGELWGPAEARLRPALEQLYDH